jgi:hypothetical protein
VSLLIGKGDLKRFHVQFAGRSTDPVLPSQPLICSRVCVCHFANNTNEGWTVSTLASTRSG